ncbi:MAG: mechanosensitive ion channel family protein [Candidatus Marinimicrobia bacterium]|nr:mechanosensitive ion channel family protein [Candidatus Neomarinimicrobiota bacterium]
MDKLSEILSRNSIREYIISLVILIGGGALFRLVTYFILRIFRKSSKYVSDEIIKDIQLAIKKILIPLGYFGIFYISFKRLTFGANVNHLFKYGLVVVLTFLGIRSVSLLVGYILSNYYAKQKKFTKEMVNGISLIFKSFVWIFGIIFLLDNLGFKVKTLMTGIGIGGVALALATQTVLADLFGYFAILFDKPFKEGDFLIIDNYLGIVEHIGIKTTRIRSLHGEELIFSNNDLLNSRIKNYISMEERRVLFNIGVTYSTPAEKLEKIPEMIKSIIGEIEDTRFDRCHFSKYGDFNLILEIVYYIKGADYNKYMDIQQKVNLAIKRKFEEEGIKFAFPTQTVHLSQENELKEA